MSQNIEYKMCKIEKGKGKIRLGGKLSFYWVVIFPSGNKFTCKTKKSAKSLVDSLIDLPCMRVRLI